MKTNESLIESVRYVEQNKQRLSSFLFDNPEVYIYGAGKYGAYALTICESIGAKVLGFITTKKEKTYYKDIPVFCVDEINARTKEDTIAIVPGFIGCDKNICRKLNCNVSYCDVNPETFLELRKATLLENAVKFFDYKFKNAETQWNNVLIIRLDAIGDVICSIPLAREIKRNCPFAKVTMLVQEQNRVLVENLPFVDSVIGYEGNRYDLNDGDDGETRKQASLFAKEKLEGSRYDVAILGMHFGVGRNDFLSIYIAMASKAKKIIGWGINSNVECSYFNYVGQANGFDISIVNRPMHETDYMLQMLLDKGMLVESRKLQIACKDIDVDEQFKQKSKGKTIVAVGLVGSMGRKTWKAQKYNQLFRRMQGENVLFLLLGGPDALAAEADLGIHENVISYIDKCSLEESINLINHCDLYLGSNTGLMHVAAALNKPCITLYSALRNATPWSGMGPVRWGVRDVPHYDLIPARGLDGCCHDCQKEYSHCINQITVFQVLNAIEKMIKKYVKAKK